MANYKYLMSVIGFIGFVLNLFLFIRFCTSKKKPFSSFHKLCLVKTMPNFMVSFVFAFWTSGISILGITFAQIPRIENIIITQGTSGFPYFLAPLIQVCMSVNRFYAIFFPMSSLKPGGFPVTNLALLIVFLLSNVPLLLMALTDCYVVYHPELGEFLPEHLERCGLPMIRLTFSTVVTLSLLSNGLNLIIFLKMFKDKVRLEKILVEFKEINFEMIGINEEQKLKRRKKWQKMYIQSVIQDFILLIDTTNYNFTSTLVDSEWWTFIFCSLSFASVYALDGAVMICFHTNFGNKNLKKSSVFVSGVNSSTMAAGMRKNTLLTN